MYIVSCFVIGYLLARLIKHRRGRRSPTALTRIILRIVEVLAVFYIVYEFRLPKFDDIDYWLYTHMFLGTTGVSFERGGLAFLLGMVVYAVRSNVKALIVTQLANRRHQGDPTTGDVSRQGQVGSPRPGGGP